PVEPTPPCARRSSPVAAPHRGSPAPDDFPCPCTVLPGARTDAAGCRNRCGPDPGPPMAARNTAELDQPNTVDHPDPRAAASHGRDPLGTPGLPNAATPTRHRVRDRGSRPTHTRPLDQERTARTDLATPVRPTGLDNGGLQHRGRTARTVDRRNHRAPGRMWGCSSTGVPDRPGTHPDPGGHPRRPVDTVAAAPGRPDRGPAGTARHPVRDLHRGPSPQNPAAGHPEVQVRRRLLHVQDSRLRMVDAAEAERRRIERDLHDGAQQHLLALTLTLTRARVRISKDPEQALALITEAQNEAKQVMEELRQVAKGLHPRVLTDHGLASALPVAAERCPLPVRLQVLLPERPSKRAEGVAYYVACEALTNVTKHARATRVDLVAKHLPQPEHGTAGLLQLTVTDDGCGGADPEVGTGLYGLWDRLDAVDGSLTVHSPPGKGTVLTAHIPWKA